MLVCDSADSLLPPPFETGFAVTKHSDGTHYLINPRGQILAQVTPEGAAELKAFFRKKIFMAVELKKNPGIKRQKLPSWPT